MRKVLLPFFVTILLIPTDVVARSDPFLGTLAECKAGKTFEEVEALEIDRGLANYNISTDNDETEFKIKYSGSHQELLDDIEVMYSPQTRTVRIAAKEDSIFIRSERKREEVAQITITISMPEEVNTDLKLVAANVNIKGKLKGNTLLDISGTGDVKAEDITAPRTELKISGEGNINLTKLETETFSAKLSGSGNLNITECKMENAALELSGAGNAQFKESVVNGLLKVEVAGAGNVAVLGQIKDLETKMSGAGNIDVSRVSGKVTEKTSGVGTVHIERGA